MHMSSPVLALIASLEHRLAKEFPSSTLCNQYAWWILESVTGYSKTQLMMHNNFAFLPAHHEQIEQWLRALIDDKKPIQYLIGSVPFNNVEILVEPPILIPRPETEEWVITLIEQLHNIAAHTITILDLCCGSGCIAIALAKALPQATVYALDIDSAAVSLTQKNITHNNINNVICLQSDLFQALPPSTRFDLIVSNPPYIAPHELPSLDDSVKKWEALHALVADDNGLEIIKKIIDQASQYLKPNNLFAINNIPQLTLEIGYLQGAIVVDLLKQAHYNTINVHKDLEGNDRTVQARKA